MSFLLEPSIKWHEREVKEFSVYSNQEASTDNGVHTDATYHLYIHIYIYIFIHTEVTAYTTHSVSAYYGGVFLPEKKILNTHRLNVTAGPV